MGAWAAGTTYAQGDQVSYGSTLYISLSSGNVGNNPSTSPTYWEPVAGMVDPTTTLGDLIVRGSASSQRLAVGTNNQVLTADNTQPLGVRWAPAGLDVRVNSTPYGISNIVNLIAGTNVTLGASSSSGAMSVTINATSAGTPASPTSSVQFNNAGAFGGSANLVWDNSNNRLGIGTSTPAVLLTLTEALSQLDYLRMVATTAGNSWALRIRDLAEGDFGIRDVTANAYRLYINAAGNLGIGTTSPQVSVETTGSIRIQGSQTPTSGQGLEIAYSGGAGYIQCLTRPSPGWGPLTFNASAFSFGNGNVGIGGAPSSLGSYTCLTVNGIAGYGGLLDMQVNGSRFLSIYQSSNQSIIEVPSATMPLLFELNGGVRMTITSAGLAGIGKSPSYMLDVAGDCNLSAGSVYRINGTPIATGGGVTTQSVATGSRALGTTYQNTVGRAMYVGVTFSANAGGCTAYTDTGNPPGTVAGSSGTQFNTGTVNLVLYFWVLPGSYYRVVSTQGTNTLSTWMEWW